MIHSKRGDRCMTRDRFDREVLRMTDRADGLRRMDVLRTFLTAPKAEFVVFATLPKLSISIGEERQNAKRRVRGFSHDEGLPMALA